MNFNIKIDTFTITDFFFYNKGLILFLKLFNVDDLRTGIGIEFHSFGAEYEYDLSNKEERDLGTANAAIDRRSQCTAMGLRYT